MSNNLSKEQIMELLPHREPMLLLDELIDIKKLHSATAIVHVTKESFLSKDTLQDNCYARCSNCRSFWSSSSSFDRSRTR